MKKVLIPLDGSERSLHSISLMKELYKPTDAEIILMYVEEGTEEIYKDLDETLKGKTYEEGRKIFESHDLKGRIEAKLDETLKLVEGYSVKKEVFFDKKVGKEILKVADDNEVDLIIMTKSTKKGFEKMIGSVTSYVVKHAKCIVLIVPE
ncbi:universal stress protein [Fusobacterium sp. IOR10]|uniref:universal stress protein n=1 Tax=Fusobacterium sp. IOR10 TaxID=2665157 RepID=UPI00193FA13E|nr:universal stress protein [Fusobacterium sp. IOR10]